MALGPKQMGEAVLRNLKTKTGKDIEAWLKVVAASKLTEKKRVMDFLKKEHELGHFQAQKVYEMFSNVDEYSDSENFPTLLFNTKELMSFYKKISTQVSKLGKDIRIQPCKTYIPFYRKNQFAIVKPFQKNKLLLGLNLPDDFNQERFIKGTSGASKRINFKTILASSKDFDSEIIDVLKMAYERN